MIRAHRHHFWGLLCGALVASQSLLCCDSPSPLGTQSAVGGAGGMGSAGGYVITLGGMTNLTTPTMGQWEQVGTPPSVANNCGSLK